MSFRDGDRRWSIRNKEHARQEELRRKRAANGGHLVGDSTSDPIVVSPDMLDLMVVEPEEDEMEPTVEDPEPEEDLDWEAPPLFGVAMSPSALERPLRMVVDGKPAVYLDELPEPEPEPSPLPFRPHYYLEGPQPVRHAEEEEVKP
jgi:hypothetical protein